jgi:hypothetical protein
MRDQVIRDLRGNWDCSQGEAEALVDSEYGKMVIAEAELCQSFAYYPAQQIGNHDNLNYTGILDNKKKISNMDDTKSGTRTVAGWWNYANTHYQNCFHTDCELCTEFEKYAESVGAVEEE